MGPNAEWIDRDLTLGDCLCRASGDAIPLAK
jgi:hypothetical protein